LPGSRKTLRNLEIELFLLRWMLRAVEFVGFNFQLMFDLDMSIKEAEEELRVRRQDLPK
jgi:hypothetical protein